MSEDLVKRLREVGGISDDGATRWYINPDGPEAADRIEKLESGEEEWNRICNSYAARIDELEAALRDLSDGWECCPVSQAMRSVARKALEGKDETIG